MNKKRAAKLLFIIVLLMACALVLFGYVRKKSGQSAQKYKVAVIAKSTESAFWKSVFAGANAAGTEYNVELSFQGPETEEDYETQNRMIEQAVADGVSAIVFSAVDYNANAKAIDEAAKKGIKIVVIDSDVNSDAVSCRISTDNYAAGQMAGRAALLCPEEKLYVGIVNFDEKTANGQEREAGFRDVVEKDERVAYIETKNVLSTTEDARQKTSELWRERPEINVIATFNEWTSLGVGWAIRDLGIKDKTTVVAFDSNVVSVGMLETGEVDALIVQNPYAMGYLGVEKAYQILTGQKLSGEKLDTATTMVNRDNMFSEECQKILFAFD